MYRLFPIKYLLLIPVSIFSVQSFGETFCVGPSDSKVKIIYLHGIDDPSIGNQERRNRKLLQRLGDTERWRIAILRGNRRCISGKKVCWTSKGSGGVERTYKYILESANKCFDTQKKFSLIGFSNGGYYLASLFNKCLAPLPQFLIAMGSSASGTVKGPCVPIALLIGKRDITLDKAKLYFRTLKQKGVDVKMSVFEGGHMIPYSKLKVVIKQFIIKGKQ